MARTGIRRARNREYNKRVATRFGACLLLLVSLGTVGEAPAQTPPPQSTLTVGILPAFSTERLVATFEPLVDALAEASGIPLQIETAPSIAEFARRTLHEHRYDVLLTAPHLYVDAARRGGYRLLARVNAEGLRVLVVVRKDSELQQLAQLSAKRIATMELIAFASVQGLEMLREAGLVPERDVELLVTPNMDAAVQAVADRHADAAFVVNTYFEERIHPERRAQFRIVSTSDDAPHLPVSAAPWIDPAVAERIAVALTELHFQRDGDFVLRKLGWRGFVRASPDEYKAMGKLLKSLRNGTP